MVLTLEVFGPPGGTPPAESRKVFRAAGGTIGRLPANDWVLPDPYVSSRHARILYADGVYHIEDMSTNGVCLNSPDNRLTRGQPAILKSGDRILIDPYEIVVSIAGPPAREAPAPYAADPFGLDTPPPFGSAPASPLPEPAGGADVDPLSLLNLEPDRPARPAAPRAQDLANQSVLSEHYRPPAPVAPPAPRPAPAPAPSGAFIPAGYDPLGESNPSVDLPPVPTPPRSAVPPPPPPVAAPSPFDTPVGLERQPAARPQPPPPPAYAPAATPPARASAPRAPSRSDLADVLAGAGITGVEVTPELAEDFGRILRVVVSGVMDVLQARQRIKDEFRMRMTTFKPAQNNPLKFSANFEDALHNLLVKRNPAYLGPVEAFEDAFDDIRHHQMAMLAGVRVAFETMLKQFDPAKLQQEFEKQGKGALIPMATKLRYWDLYCGRFSDMVADADACFRELFGHEFAKAYEEQLERLKAQDRSRRSR
jgi:type VI secretion system FHA domain protein